MSFSTFQYGDCGGVEDLIATKFFIFVHARNIRFTYPELTFTVRNNETVPEKFCVSGFNFIRVSFAPTTTQKSLRATYRYVEPSVNYSSVAQYYVSDLCSEISEIGSLPDAS